MERCTLCGGKLANGRCLECGLDNTKNDKKYNLNIHNEKETQFHRGNCEDHLNQNCDSSREWGKSVPRGEGAAAKSRNAARDRSGAGGEAPQMSKAQRAKILKERSRTGTVKKKSGLSRLIFWIVILVILFQIFGGVLAGMISYVGSPEWEVSSVIENLLRTDGEDDDADGPELGNEEGAFAVEPSGERPEEIVWNEQAAGYFEEGLTMGVYTVGYEIPAGTYQMFCNEGTAWCYLFDARGDESEYFALYSRERQESYAESFGECDYFELSQELKLKEGDVLYVEECDEGVFIKGEGDGEESLRQHEPQGLPGDIVVADGMTAGEEFEPGVYDVTMGEIPEDMYGDAYLSVTREDGGSYYISLHQEMPVFHRFFFQEGDVIELTAYGAETEVTLTPSY